ncbi:response regulator transcription factor [Brevibacillus sp. B_LB10_24]|uniref:response regulator transcription factor n=1 Tax=Brevibacillus sp. B_LB10_24 TaxID=3380645 RepID=UPI0038BE17F9
MKEKILLADDEPDMISFLEDALVSEGYVVITALSGEEVFSRLKEKPDLIILDVMMPGLDGWEVCQSIRPLVACPILFLSARGHETDRIKGLMVGGDDYLVKPFSVKEFKARINAHLRRERRVDHRRPKVVLHCKDLLLDLNQYQLYHQGRQVSLTVRELEIVQFLMMNADQVFSREQIYEKVWGFEADGNSATVTEHIKKIRAKLAEFDPMTEYISTVWGFGYKMGAK